MPGRMMSQRGGGRGRAPLHAARGSYYGGMLMSTISVLCTIHDLYQF